MVNILEILVILANLTAIITGSALSVTVFIRNKHAKTLGETLSGTEFSEHPKILTNVKTTAFCAVVFLILAWVMFSSQQEGFMNLSTLSFLFAVLWGLGLIFTAVISSVNSILFGKGSTDGLTRKKMNCFLLWAVVNFIIAFLLY